VWDFAEGVNSDTEGIDTDVDTDVDVDLMVVGRAIPLHSLPKPPKRLSAGAPAPPPLSAGAPPFERSSVQDSGSASLSELGRWMLGVALSS